MRSVKKYKILSFLEKEKIEEESIKKLYSYCRIFYYAAYLKKIFFNSI